MHNGTCRIAVLLHIGIFFKIVLIMKPIIYFFLILMSMNSKAQLPKDTLYINKNANRIVFVDSPHSKFHDLVFKYLLLGFEKNVSTKSDNIPAENWNSSYLGEFITIKKFKGKYFAYLPSEPYNNIFIKVTDSSVSMNDFNDGFVSYRIDKKVKKVKKIKINLIGNDSVRHILTIKQKLKSLFVIKSTLFNIKKIHFVKRHNYYDYPIIVNYCPFNRCEEFSFH